MQKNRWEPGPAGVCKQNSWIADQKLPFVNKQIAKSHVRKEESTNSFVFIILCDACTILQPIWNQWGDAFGDEFSIRLSLDFLFRCPLGRVHSQLKLFCTCTWFSVGIFWGFLKITQLLFCGDQTSSAPRTTPFWSNKQSSQWALWNFLSANDRKHLEGDLGRRAKTCLFIWVCKFCWIFVHGSFASFCFTSDWTNSFAQKCFFKETLQIRYKNWQYFF